MHGRREENVFFLGKVANVVGKCSVVCKGYMKLVSGWPVHLTMAFSRLSHLSLDLSILSVQLPRYSHSASASLLCRDYR